MAEKESIELKTTAQELADLLVSVVMMAKATRAFYESLVKEGFSPVQALDIIKARGVNMVTNHYEG